jgi:hypothetical protein
MNGLHFASDLHDHRTTQGQFSAQPVNILPLQSSQLRPPQTQTDAHNSHCAIRLRENAAQTMELFDLSVPAFRPVLDAFLIRTSSNELNAWLGQESGKPVHVATENTDLTAELKRGLSFIRRDPE